MQKLEEEIGCFIKTETTYYEETPLRIESRFVCQRTSESLYLTGRVFFTIDSKTEIRYIGAARCSDTDPFVMERGREIARGRALKALWWGVKLSIESREEQLKYVNFSLRTGERLAGYILNDL